MAYNIYEFDGEIRIALLKIRNGQKKSTPLMMN